MNFTKTAVAAAIAALAVPAAADAAKPADAGSKGKQQQTKSKAKQVGFSLSGTGLTGQTGTSALTDPFSLDLVSANKHARNALKVDEAFIDGTGTTPIDVAAGDTYSLKLSGVTDGADEGTDVSLADVLATDRVKVVGKVVRTRTKAKGSKPAFTYGAVDIRKVVVTRGETETETSETPAQPQS